MTVIFFKFKFKKCDTHLAAGPSSNTAVAPIAIVASVPVVGAPSGADGRWAGPFAVTADSTATALGFGPSVVPVAVWWRQTDGRGEWLSKNKNNNKCQKKNNFFF